MRSHCRHWTARAALAREGREDGSRPLTPMLRRGRIPTVNAEKLERLLAPFWRIDDGQTAAERAQAYGIDLSLIAENLRLTPEERMDRNQAALEFAVALQEVRG